MHPNVVDGGKGTNGVGNIIGTMGKGGEAGGDNLDSREEALGLGVKLGGVLMSSKGGLVLSLVDIVVEAAKELGLHALSKGLVLFLELN